MNCKSQAEKQTFRSYLFDQIDLDSPYGDLARDAKADRDWEGETATSLRQRLHSRRAPNRVFDVLEELRRLYEEDTNQSPADKVKKMMQGMNCNECYAKGFIAADTMLLQKAYICPICDGYGFFVLDPNGENDWEDRMNFYADLSVDLLAVL